MPVGLSHWMRRIRYPIFFPLDSQVLDLTYLNQFLTNTSPEAMELTDTMLSVIRQQRHLGARVIIATQEPTISPALLDLCNVTIVHRFTSPAWYSAIEKHIAGAATAKGSKSTAESDLFRDIVQLATGEALLFCATALVDIVLSADSDERRMNEEGDDKSQIGANGVSNNTVSIAYLLSVGEGNVKELGSSYLKIRIRKRVTADGGRSHLQC